MKRMALILVLLASSAAAQQPPAPDPLRNVGEDWNAMQIAQRHLSETLQAVVAELTKLRAENATLKADAAKAKHESIPGVPANGPPAPPARSVPPEVKKP